MMTGDVHPSKLCDSGLVFVDRSEHQPCRREIGQVPLFGRSVQQYLYASGKDRVEWTTIMIGGEHYVRLCRFDSLKRANRQVRFLGEKAHNAIEVVEVKRVEEQS